MTRTMRKDGRIATGGTPPGKRGSLLSGINRHEEKTTLQRVADQANLPYNGLVAMADYVVQSVSFREEHPSWCGKCCVLVVYW